MSSNDSGFSNTCIYCPSIGPFTAEHVIPAGLGGDDRRFMLRGMVCKRCNTTIFSPLEREFLRKTPAALGRIFLQPEGRRRGKTSNPPKLEARSKVLIAPEGYPVEIELGSRAQPIVLPQMVLIGERDGQTTGSDEMLLREYVESARTLLAATVTCVRNEPVEGVRSLLATTYTWGPDGYERGETRSVSEPPLQSIWNIILEPNEDGSEPSSRARMFRRENGQIVLRVTEKLGVERALTFFRKVLEQSNFEVMAARDIQNPPVRFDMSFQLDVIGRLIAKIGINLLAYLVGSDYVKHPEFQKIKRAILTGDPEIQLLPTEQKASIANIFSGLPITQHGFIIVAKPGPFRTCSLAVVTRLYGSLIEMISLGENLPWPDLPNHTFFAVDYQMHRIERYEMLDFVRAFPFRFTARGDAANEASAI
ncbi:hypothetical protein [Caballeronia sordidicola]|uniref:hypothetical protein n=1 Tax=Caballeronia sordidicola TaxID=196367 RepID=UPI0004D0337C|nr:hypothetical protein [Caballeronia sordidicola]